MKNAMQKKVIFCFLAMLFMGSYVFAQSDEAVNLPDNARSTLDVIVRNSKYFEGFQTRILNTDDTYIYYIQFKSRGREKEKKMNLKKVAFTLTFTENAKLTGLPALMNMQDYLSLPTYKWGGYFLTFGTQKITAIPHLEKIKPDIAKSFTKGNALYGVGNLFFAWSYFIGILPGFIIGGILTGSGATKISNAFVDYYNDCVSLEVCEKYGIIITPYNLNKAITLK